MIYTKLISYILYIEYSICISQGLSSTLDAGNIKKWHSFKGMYEAEFGRDTYKPDECRQCREKGRLCVRPLGQALWDEYGSLDGGG